MELKLLGTGGYHPNEIRHTPCLLLPELGIAFDAGTAAFRLPGQVIRPDLHLFLTHPHWDHIIGLTYLLVPMLLEKLTSVTIYGNQHTLAAVQTHLFAEPTFHHMPAFKFCSLESIPAGIPIESCHIQWFPLPSHPGGSVGYRITQGDISWAYVTDTFMDGSYHQKLSGVGTLIHECYFADDMQAWAEKTGHSYLSQVASLARDVSAGQLLLTHMDPRIEQSEPFCLEAARKIFPQIHFASDLQTLQL